MEIHNLSGASRDAAWLVLVQGWAANRAAEHLNVAESTVSRAIAKLKRPVCQCCGQPMS